MTEPFGITSFEITPQNLTAGIVEQIYHEDLFDAQGQRQGEVWGPVDIHARAGHCGQASRHLHVIWARDGQLRQSAIAAEVDFGDFEPPSAPGLLAAAVRDRLIATRDTGPSVIYDATPSAPVGMTICIRHPQAVKDALYAASELNRLMAQQVVEGPEVQGEWGLVRVTLSAAVRAAWHEFDEAIDALGEASRESLLAKANVEIAVEWARREAVSAATRAIASMPQIRLVG